MNDTHRILIVVVDARRTGDDDEKGCVVAFQFAGACTRADATPPLPDDTLRFPTPCWKLHKNVGAASPGLALHRTSHITAVGRTAADSATAIDGGAMSPFRNLDSRAIATGNSESTASSPSAGAVANRCC